MNTLQLVFLVMSMVVCTYGEDVLNVSEHENMAEKNMADSLPKSGTDEKLDRLLKIVGELKKILPSTVSLKQTISLLITLVRNFLLSTRLFILKYMFFYA